VELTGRKILVRERPSSLAGNAARRARHQKKKLLAWRGKTGTFACRLPEKKKKESHVAGLAGPSATKHRGSAAGKRGGPSHFRFRKHHFGKGRKNPSLHRKGEGGEGGCSATKRHPGEEKREHSARWTDRAKGKKKKKGLSELLNKGLASRIMGRIGLLARWHAT